MAQVKDLVKDIKDGTKIRVIGFVKGVVGLPAKYNMYEVSPFVTGAIMEIIGVDIDGEVSYAKGECFVVIGKKVAVTTTPGMVKVFLVVEGTLKTEGNFAEVTTSYSSMGLPKLYATKKIYSGSKEIKEEYQQMVNVALLSYNRETESFDYDEGFKKAGIEFPPGYVETTGQHNSMGEINEPEPIVPRERVAEVAEKPKERKQEKGREDIRPRPVDFEERLSLPVINAKQQVSRDLERFIYNNEIERDTEGEEVEYEKGIEEIMLAYGYLSKNWGGRKAVSGREIYKRAIKMVFPDKEGVVEEGVDLIEELITVESLKFWAYDKDSHGNNNLEDLKRSRNEVYIAIVDTILGFRGKYLNMYNQGKELGVDTHKMVKINPYMTTLIYGSMSVSELEQLMYVYQVPEDGEGIAKYKNVAYMHNKMVDSNNGIMGSSTIKKMRDVMQEARLGIEVSASKYNKMMATGLLFDEQTIKEIQGCINPKVEKADFRYPLDRWEKKRYGGGYIREELVGRQIVEDYLKSGVGVKLELGGEAYITDIVYARREIDVIERLYYIDERTREINASEEEIEEYIAEFEAQKSLELNIPNFKLEERQRDAVKLIRKPIICITGGAGSGKTTTAEAMLYVLKKITGIQEREIISCAPTGKAADRLQEVIKRPSSTIHSTFNIGPKLTEVIESEPQRKLETQEIKNMRVLVIDEASMIDVELMNEVLNIVEMGTRVIILGDIAQLPPIGVGKPYSNLLDILPTVVLNVSKRAKEGSGITLNATRINEESDGRVAELENTDDFKMINIRPEETLKLIQGIVGYHLGTKEVEGPNIVKSVGVGMNPDDIQVITPLNNREWGVKYLNEGLQDIFNPRKQGDVKYLVNKGYITGLKGEKRPNIIKYGVGDRVIHLKNDHRRVRLDKLSEYEYEVRADKGIMNGAVGTIVGIKDKKDIVINVPEGYLDEASPEVKAAVNKLVKEEGRNKKVIEVMYRGVDVKGLLPLYSVFYIIEDKELDPYTEDREVHPFGDIMDLDLAYVLTVHKTQGSQAKLVIFVVQQLYGDFISRNLIYTGVTRAEQGVYLVGDVVGPGSQLSRSRRIEENSRRISVVDKLY